MVASQYKTLLVEGNDDLHVVIQLLKSNGVEEPKNLLNIKDMNGYETLIHDLPTEIKNHKNQQNACLGVMVDANGSLPSRWESVTKAFKDKGYHSISEKPQPGGLIIPSFDEISPKIGIWVMPDNQSTGMIEDFARFLVPQGDAQINYAEECVNNIDEPKFRPSYKTKSVIHTWLAWQEDPGIPLGHAIMQKYLDSNCQEATAFVQWLTDLFKD